MLATTYAQSLALKAKLFRGFSDPSRLSILEAVREQARSVSDIVEITGLNQPNVSNHLACLLDCGLVAREQQGRFAFYRLSDARVGQLLATADEILSDVAQGMYICPATGAPKAERPEAIVLTASLSASEGFWRRLIAALLVVCISLSSVESLWGDVPSDGPEASEVTGADMNSGLTGASRAQTQSEEPEEDCPCLCDCACVNAQRAVHPDVMLAPSFDLSALPRLARGDPRAPGSVDLEPHLRPPQA